MFPFYKMETLARNGLANSFIGVFKTFCLISNIYIRIQIKICKLKSIKHQQQIKSTELD